MLFYTKYLAIICLFLFLLSIPTSIFAAGPAGVETGLKLWFSSDSGAKDSGGDSAIDGETIETWEDQSTDARTATRQAGGAIYSTTGLNYNPTLNFNNSNYTFSDTGLPPGSSDRSIFVVASINDIGSWRYVLGAGTFGGGHGFDFGNRAGSGVVFITTHSSQEAQAGSWQPTGTARLAYGSVTGATLYLGVNGADLVAGGSGVNTVLDGSANVGANSGGSERWNGNISEVIMFDRTVTSTERQRINSYLALKYGFSLDQSTAQSYLASGTAVMWDKDAAGASTYNNGLFGIGRDDSSNLAQLKSRGQTSTNVIVLEADNEGQNGDPNFVDIDNLEFLTIGDNNGSASWTTTGAPSGYSILARQWKKQEQGDVGPVKMDFDVADSDFNIPAPLDSGNYYFIYDTDNDNSLADETPQSMTDQGSNLWRVIVNFGSGGLFSLASTQNPAIVNLSPADNATTISVSSNLVIKFSQAVTVDTGNITIHKTSDDSTIETISVTSGQVTGSGSDTITINPASNLGGSTNYYVLIPNTAFKNSSNYFGGISSTLSWNFETEIVPTTAPTATPIPSSGGFDPEGSEYHSNATNSTNTCNDVSPSGTPDLFQINVSNDKATLFFTPLHSNVTNYYIAYGYTKGEERFGVFTDLGSSTGVLSYTINHLDINTAYYFKIRPQNGCTPGNWGNDMKATSVKTSAEKKTFYKNIYTQILSFLPTKVTPLESKKIKPAVSKTKKINACEYTVQTGDSLWNIAKRKLGNGERYSEIMRENNFIDPVVNQGMILKIGC